MVYHRPLPYLLYVRMFALAAALSAALGHGLLNGNGPSATLLALGLLYAIWLGGIPLLTQKLRWKDARREGLLLLGDSLALLIWLSFSGGASSGYVSLLLVPIAIAVIVLPTAQSLLIAALGCGGYTLLLFWPAPANQHSAMMQHHFVDMWINFLITVAIFVLVLAALVRQLRAREQHLAELHQKQLRAESVTALGLAAAQASHQLSTPIATLMLLHEELQAHQHPSQTQALLESMSPPLQQCQHSLAQIRAAASRLRQPAAATQLLTKLIAELKNQALLLWPQMQLQISPTEQDSVLSADPALLPALLNLLQNAATVERTSEAPIELRARSCADGCQLAIVAAGAQIDAQTLPRLGITPVPSESGLGVGTLLSHATIERLGGRLDIHADEQAVEVLVYLPSIKPMEHP